MISAGGAPRSSLPELARLYGVQAAYYDVDRRRRLVSPEAVFRVLRALGAPIETEGDVPAALRQRRLAFWRRRLEPVTLAWDGTAEPLALRLPADAAGSARCQLVTEDGEHRHWTLRLEDLRRAGQAKVEGIPFVELVLTLPPDLATGYHQLSVEIGGEATEALVLSAPRRAHVPGGGRQWGVFLPLYALRSGRDWGSGDFGDLEALVDWSADLGAGVLATLPLLPAFLDEPFNPSPYSPVSRLFWNELYIDVTRVPELVGCPPALETLGSPRFRHELEELRAGPMVDYRRTMVAKRHVLEALSRSFFCAGAADRRAAFDTFVAQHPRVEEYARFRAAGERLGVPWPAWPESMRRGVVTDSDIEEDIARYHLYAQWIAHEQIYAASVRARDRGMGLYFDLPLGVHPDGYDTWRERDSFARGVSAGAPPDTFFSRGQDWEFPPLHPENIRLQGFRYVIETVRHHLRAASILRIDHVMGLHRLYWIPEGAAPGEGVYVRYPAEELYAILSLESHRHRAVVVGEDLGTVPRYVPAAMARHGIHRTYVLQYDASPDPARPLGAPHHNSVASLNTHDMPPFAAFWQGLDIDDHVDLGLFSPEASAGHRERLGQIKSALVRFLRREGWLKEETQEVREVLRACLRWLAGNGSRFVLVNLEDTWLETQSQNVPGTSAERPNWRRKSRHSLGELATMPEVTGILREVGRLRRPAGLRA